MRLTGSTLVMIAGLVTGPGCYRDALGPEADLAPTTVLLTDAPFPFGLVDRVEVYVSQIAASMTADTLPEAQRWLIISEPRRRYDFLALQQGATELGGAGQLETGAYHAVRMTVNGDSSRIVLHDGRTARVRWPASGDFIVPAVVEQPFGVTAGGVTVVLDFDVGRSFVYNVDPLFDFVFVPALRAVRADSTGRLSGMVLGDADGDAVLEPIADAVVTVYRGNALASSSTWGVVATGRTNVSGRYTIAFLPPGSYIVQLEAPWSTRLAAISVPDILIVVGTESHLDATLPGAPPPPPPPAAGRAARRAL
jgi:hypothetical protein